jgi:DNA (cytosine-5)-methyltransferase 3A
MNVLSLFDGISCGQIALNRAGIKYDNYFSSEIDWSAIEVTQYNYPKTIQLGDVTKLKEYDLPHIDLLIGGSPCQGFSFAGKQLNFNDERSKLFFEFVRLLKETNPKYFLLENVKMKQEYQDVISEHLGVKPIIIDSNLVSAQNRKRLYWTNIPVKRLPEDRNINLDDVIDKTLINKTATNWEKYSNGIITQYLDPYNRRAIKGQKSTTLRTNIYNGNMWVLNADGNGYRNMTVEECEKLQTIPEGYTVSVSESKSKKLIGNAWTVEIISYICNFIN